MNTQKGFLSLLGLLVTVLIIGGGAYFYIQSDLSLLRVEKNATSTNGAKIIDTAQSLIDEKNKGQCFDNYDCGTNEICYFKPGGDAGSCIPRMENKKTIDVDIDIEVCMQDKDCGTNGSCYFEPGGETGVCR